MANKELRTKIVLRNDTPEQWSSINPALLKGEFGVEISESGVTKVKIGKDGVTTWNDLPYFGETAKTEVDEKVVKYNTNGELTLVGFADAATGARLQKTATGVEWVVPGSDGTMTEEELQEAIKGLTQDVTNLGNNLDAIEAIVGEQSIEEGIPSTGLIGQVEALEAKDGVLATEIEALETALEDVYTKAEADNAIAAAIADVDHLKRIIVPTLPVDSINENAIYMVSREGANGEDVYNEYMYINGTWEIIGNTSVDLSEYAKKEDILVKSVSSDFIITETGQLALKTNAAPEIDGSNITNIGINNVVGLQTILDSKVAAEQGKSLIANTLITKLEELAELKSVSEEFTLNEGMLSVKSISAEKITGLPEAFTGYIKSVAINGNILAMDENQQVNIPIASDTVLGVVKGAVGNNKVAIAADGTMSVNSVNITSLVQNEGDWLEINGGSADFNAWN